MPNKPKASQRCPWPLLSDPLYLKYHDTEWGVPVYNDNKIFEFLVLETFQAGLSWRTILHKRKNFRKAFKDFNPNKLAKFTARDINRLMQDPGIVRNKLKITSAINNAKKYLQIQKEFGSFSKYMWAQVNNRPIKHKIKTLADYPQFTQEAVKWAKDLKKRGFKFLGPVVVYSHMQAVGMVNDHVVNCFRYK